MRRVIFVMVLHDFDDEFIAIKYCIVMMSQDKFIV